MSDRPDADADASVPPAVTPSNGADAAPQPSADGGSTDMPAGASGEPTEDPRVRELHTLVVHLKADFDNYRKRAQKELASASRSGEIDAIRRFLPAFANFERALQAAGQAEGPLVEGLRATQDQLQKTLKSMGIERIPGVGTPFDPTLHEAVAATQRPDVPPGTITDEFEPGYSADGKAIIPAKVRVATAE